MNAEWIDFSIAIREAGTDFVLHAYNGVITSDNLAIASENQTWPDIAKLTDGLKILQAVPKGGQLANISLTGHGSFVWEWLLKGSIGDKLVEQLYQINDSPQKRLRLWLCFDPEVLQNMDFQYIFWETLAVPAQFQLPAHIHNRFLSLSDRISIARSILDAPWHPILAVAEPLRVLVVSCNLQDKPINRLENILNACLNGLDPLYKAGAILCPPEYILRNPTPMEVLRKIKEINPHILVTICHGERSIMKGERSRLMDGKFILSDGRRGKADLFGQQIAAAVKEMPNPQLRLIFMPHCRTAAAAPFLLMAGVPAVVAMQEVVADDLVMEDLTKQFFESLTTIDLHTKENTFRKTLDECLTDVRSLLSRKYTENDPHWFLTTLWLTTTDSRLFAPKKEIILGRYLRYLIDQYREMPSLEGEPLPLENFYITLILGGEVERKPNPSSQPERPDLSEESIKKETFFAWRESHEYNMPRQIEHVRIEDGLRSNRLLVVKGDPGGGKSTLIQYLAYHLAMHYLGEGRSQLKSIQLIPIVIKLSEWSASNLNLVEYLQKRWLTDSGIPSPTDSDFSRTDFTNLVIDWIKQGKCILLLDGLDEVSSNRTELINSLNALSNENGLAGPSKILVTTRIVGYANDELNKFKHYELLPFNRKQTEQFIKGYFPGDSEKGELLIRAIQNNFQMKPLAANPLLLKIICWAYKDPKQNLTLPARRIELYDWAVHKMLARRKIATKAGKIRSILEGVALHYFPKQIFPEDELLSVIRDLLEAKKINSSQDDSFLDDMVKSGLLVQLSKENYIFLHLTFQEYFAACAISSISEKTNDEWMAIVKANMKNSKWEEVIRLLAAKLAQKEMEQTSHA